MTSDSELRALAREEPERLVALVHAFAPGLIAPNQRITAEDVDDPYLKLPGRERIVDFVARIGTEEVLHLEFHAYQDKDFGLRTVEYYTGLQRRYPGRVVSTVVVWLIKPKGEVRNEIRSGPVTMQVEMVVLPEIPATLLLEHPELACFAVGADRGTWSVEQQCHRVAKAMVRQKATHQAWQVASAVAQVQKRFQPWRRAMQQVRQERFIKNEFIRYGYQQGKKKGHRQGLKEGLDQGIQQGVQQGIQQGVQQGVQQGIQQGVQQGLQWLKQSLVEIYRTRFGKLLPGLIKTVQSVQDPDILLQWQPVFATQSTQHISALLKRMRRNRVVTAAQQSVHG